MIPPYQEGKTYATIHPDKVHGIGNPPLCFVRQIYKYCLIAGQESPQRYAQQPPTSQKKYGRCRPGKEQCSAQRHQIRHTDQNDEIAFIYDIAGEQTTHQEPYPHQQEKSTGIGIHTSVSGQH